MFVHCPCPSFDKGHYIWFLGFFSRKWHIRQNKKAFAQLQQCTSTWWCFGTLALGMTNNKINSLRHMPVVDLILMIERILFLSLRLDGREKVVSSEGYQHHPRRVPALQHTACMDGRCSSIHPIRCFTLYRIPDQINQRAILTWWLLTTSRHGFWSSGPVQWDYRSGSVLD